MQLLLNMIISVLVLFLLGCQLDLDKNKKSKDKDIIGSYCGPLTGPSKYDITEMSLVVSHGETVYQEGAPLPYNAMSISIRAAIQFLAKTDKRKLEYGFSLFPSAHACSPITPYTEENVKSLNIRSSFNFNDDFLAGENLNQFFDVVSAESSTPNYTYKNGKRISMNLVEYLNQEEVDAGRDIVLKLNTQPNYYMDQTFYIDLELDSGDKFQLQSPLISLKEKVMDK